MYNLFLDDERNVADVTWVELPKNDWIVVRNYAEFISIIQTKGMPNFITFDHDLADEHYMQSIHKKKVDFKEKTGYECAKWLIEHCLDNNFKLPEFKVHSMNVIGKENIEKLLANYKKHE